MNTFNAMAEVLKREGTEYLFCFPTLDLIEVTHYHRLTQFTGLAEVEDENEIAAHPRHRRHFRACEAILEA